MSATPTRSTERLVQEALAASGVGAWDYDIPRGLCFCDPTMATFYGLAADEGEKGVSIDRMTETIHPADRARGLAMREAKIRRGGLFVNEYRVSPRAGRLRWLLARGRYEADASGRVVRAHGIAIDVTESKRDGYAEGQAFFLSEFDHDERESPLERAAAHALAARRAIDDMGERGLPAVRPAVDMLLFAIGRLLAEETARGFPQ